MSATNIDTENEKEEKELNKTTDYVNKNKNIKLTEDKSLKTDTAKNFTDEQKTQNIKLSNEVNTPKSSSQPEVELYIIPANLNRTLVVVLCATILGLSLMGLGFVSMLTGFLPSSGNSILLILGCLILIPGGYYSFRFYKGRVARSAYARKEIFDSIPRL